MLLFKPIGKKKEEEEFDEKEKKGEIVNNTFSRITAIPY